MYLISRLTEEQRSVKKKEQRVMDQYPVSALYKHVDYFRMPRHSGVIAEGTAYDLKSVCPLTIQRSESERGKRQRLNANAWLDSEVTALPAVLPLGVDILPDREHA